MKQFFISLIRLYQRFISPLKPRTCRFYPTCSAYSLESYQRFGAVKGTYLTIVRIIKCHPFHPGGLDPVPDPGPRSKKARKKENKELLEGGVYANKDI